MSAAASSSSTPVVQLQDIVVEYPNGVRALNHITLDVFHGDLMGLIGPNGAGKSTLLGVILGLVAPTSGSARLFGKSISSKSLMDVGYVPQNAQPADRQFPSTVFETVLLGRVASAGMFHRLGKRDHEKVHSVLSLLDISDLSDRKIGELSGGQMQRVFVAKAIVSDPKLLLLDEPTSGVDSKSKNEFYSTLARLNREMSLTIVLSSHDIGAITSLANRVVCINRSLFFCGETSDLTSSSILSKVYDYPVELIHHTDHA